MAKANTNCEGNALWLQKDFPIRDEFLQLARGNYDATVEQLDFVAARDQARNTINKTVAEQTGGKIKELLASNSLSEDTRLVLTNAIYFKGDWDLQFAVKKTKLEAFHVSQLIDVHVPFVRLASGFPDHFKYFEEPPLQGLEMPYRGGDLSMLVLLPGSNQNLAQFEDLLTPANINRWFSESKTSNRPLDLKLPRFKTTLRFNLSDTLRALGINRAFSRQADFSGISSKEELFIGEVSHKAFIAVDEKGSEATAATFLKDVISVSELSPPSPPPIKFHADHPFISLIRDNRTGSILFLGRICDPSKEE